mgnify:CR=1 FL=1
MINALLLLYWRQEFFFVIIQRISHNTCICYGKVVSLRPIRVLTTVEVSIHFESVNVLTSVEVRQLN